MRLAGIMHRSSFWQFYFWGLLSGFSPRASITVQAQPRIISVSVSKGGPPLLWGSLSKERTRIHYSAGDTSRESSMATAWQIVLIAEQFGDWNGIRELD